MHTRDGVGWRVCVWGGDRGTGETEREGGTERERERERENGKNKTSMAA